MIKAPAIVTCPSWGARRPTRPPKLAGRPTRIIVHHTAGHAPSVDATHANDYRAAVDYALALQRDMIERRGWADSGHSFLVMRSGLILQGRWGTVTALQHGRMVVSAHCPGQNDQPGIEHEHVNGELLTGRQRAATVWLMAWICDRTAIRPTELYGHQHYYATSCPGNLEHDIPALRLEVARKLTAGGPPRRGRATPWLGLTVRSGV